jgi:WD40 repeat protein
MRRREVAVREFVGPTEPILNVLFIPGEPTRLAAVTGNELFLWNLGESEPQDRLQFREAGRIETVLEASPDGQWIVAGPPESLDAIPVDAREQKRAISFPQLYRSQFVESSVRLTVIYRAQANGRTRLMRGTIPVALAGPTTERLTPIEYSLSDDQARGISLMPPPIRRHVVTLAANGSRLAIPMFKVVFVWDGNTGTCLGPIRTRGFPCAISISPDGSRIAIDSGTTVYVHDSTSLDLVSKWKTKYCYGPGLAWSPDGRFLGRADASTAARIYDAETGREICSLGKKRGINWCIGFSPDGLTFATGTYDGDVRVWDLE